VLAQTVSCKIGDYVQALFMDEFVDKLRRVLTGRTSNSEGNRYKVRPEKAKRVNNGFQFLGGCLIPGRNKFKRNDRRVAFICKINYIHF